MLCGEVLLDDIQLMIYNSRVGNEIEKVAIFHSITEIATSLYTQILGGYGFEFYCNLACKNPGTV